MKKLGFGFMRLPMTEGEIGDADGVLDKEQICEMIDRFLASGFTYFDTAHNYIGGKSETGLRDFLIARHPRETFYLANKLTETYFQSEADIIPFFESQLQYTGVSYFDNYLMHAISSKNYDKYVSCRAFETAAGLKAEGKIRHIGISFHDKAAFLDKVLTERPEIEFVQIQFNYLDFDDPVVESGAVYDVCVKHGKPVIVMEPVKGGDLAALPEDAAAILDALGGGSHASYAIRFVASFENVKMILSGMSTIGQMEDNTSFMSDCKPLDETEMAAVTQVRELLRARGTIACTACRYCVEGCPVKIRIPQLFSCYNLQKMFGGDYSFEDYARHTAKVSPSECIECGQCEDICPQHLPIRELLRTVADEFKE